MTAFRRHACKRICATLVAASLAFQPLVGYAATITESLAQVPIQGLNPVKPNIMFTMDDSGSMDWDWLPDYTAYVASGIYHCRDSRNCGVPNSAPPTNGTVLTQWDPPIRSNAYNPVFYDASATYRAGKKADGTNLPCEGSDTTCATPWTSVYVDGYSGYPGANSAGTINLTTSYPDTAWCWKSPSAADKLTADSDGSVCRRNGRAYSLLTVSGNTTPAIAAGYNYPNTSATCSGSQKCKFITASTVNGAPYYYTINQVRFCSAKDAAGWGTTASGTCTSQWDPTTYKYVLYGTGASFDPLAFTRIDIKSAGILVNGVSASNPSGRTYAQEMTNFAIWYAFYRTRIQSMKAAAGIAFSALDQNSRVGFHTLHENATLFTNIKDFTSANKLTWLTNAYKVNPNGGTDLPNAMWRIGELFSGNLAATTLPGATDPLDPITGKCQPNFHLLSTDGYWNGSFSYTSRGNNDKTVPALANLPGATGFTPGSLFPDPYREGPTTTSDNLADLAMYYWIRDIRPTIADKVKDSLAPWQHVNLYSLAIGARGTIAYPNGISAITAGTVDWPVATGSGSGGPPEIDDLWHAAVNGHGKYFNASNAQQLAESIVSALADFTDQSGTGTAVGLGGSQLSVTNQYGYKTSYEAGIWGDVKKYAINITTGVLPVDANGNPLAAPIWSAATKLDTQAAVVGAVNGWDTQRRIVTINDATSTAVPFRLANLSAAQQSSLSVGWSAVVTPPPTSQMVLNFLRGDKTNEGINSGSFRTRSHLLGDIVYSGAVPVAAPNAPYLDTGVTGSPNPGYNAFKSAKASRTPAVYVGSNDGMLHAFDDSVTNGGTETWAFIPAAMFSGGDPNDTAHTSDPAYQIGALAYRRGGIPLFNHKFYVNATPRVWDVDFAFTNTTVQPQTGNDWRTVLVGGLGAGGRSVYALDVTTPVAAPPPVVSTDTETTAATKVLWEYTEANLGYVYDAPTLVKTKAYGWVVLVASGYNNPGGKGFLYVLNPKAPTKAGQLLKKIALPGDTGTDASPTDLNTIRSFNSRQNPYVLQAYGGDIKGNVWRFDLSDANATNWKAEKIATLKDGTGKAQPITSGVRVEIDQNNNVDRYLFVGTGKLLDQQDLLDTSVINSFYVIKDGTYTTPEAAPAIPYSRSNLTAVTGTSVAGLGGAAIGRGWYQDGVDGADKINSDVYADVNVAVFGFSKPSTDPCLAVLSSTLFARDLTSGNSVLLSGSTVVASVAITGGIAGVTLVQADPGASTATPPVLVQVTTMTGQVESIPVNLQAAITSKHRVSWGLVTP
ncbi:MAG: PilC/PilY family type IV pilus protein [Betaproteobacteria bacterium]